MHVWLLTLLLLMLSPWKLGLMHVWLLILLLLVAVALEAWPDARLALAKV